MPYRKIFFGFSLIASLMLWGASVATWDLPLSATASLSALGLEKSGVPWSGQSLEKQSWRTMGNEKIDQ